MQKLGEMPDAMRYAEYAGSTQLDLIQQMKELSLGGHPEPTSNGGASPQAYGNGPSAGNDEPAEEPHASHAEHPSGLICHAI